MGSLKTKILGRGLGLETGCDPDWSSVLEPQASCRQASKGRQDRSLLGAMVLGSQKPGADLTPSWPVTEEWWWLSRACLVFGEGQK